MSRSYFSTPIGTCMAVVGQLYFYFAGNRPKTACYVKAVVTPARTTYVRGKLPQRVLKVSNGTEEQSCFIFRRSRVKNIDMKTGYPKRPQSIQVNVCDRTLKQAATSSVHFFPTYRSQRPNISLMCDLRSWEGVRITQESIPRSMFTDYENFLLFLMFTHAMHNVRKQRHSLRSWQSLS
jgi:hypothetical protein